MKETQMKLINKLFKDKTIRTVWNKEEEKYYVSVIDIITVLTNSSRPRKYWEDLKKKFSEEGSQLSEKIGQLKLKSSDGKYYKTDICDIEQMFRIIESIPSKNAEPIKLWLARLGKERIDETFDPLLAVQRAISRGSDKDFTDGFFSRGDSHINDCERNSCPNKIVLRSGEYLSDVLERCK